ncbi:glycosyltransferase family 9 protein [Aquifex aeolicus]|uniref:ADP-heptose:LPS heptosyltransferase n=1 Tax=Aquifex aeolicus (strain VF5) TaxID=224324 RepID=O66538_AQUAE|nr:glycosyltransferase family 9 protein [Aquifex aeolicus]AAC06484.1 ADP-heptose:LPS heptosyltransferase [Aquifex aeolicus VF5]
MKILIWQTAYLGDVVLATPLIQTLKKNFPDAKIGFVGRPFIKELFKDEEVELIPYSKKFKESFTVIRKIKNYDVVISPHRSMRTALILFFSGIKERIGFDRSDLPFLYTKLVPHRWELHEVDRNLELLKPLGVKEFIRETKLKMKEEEYRKILNKFNLKEKKYIVISPFSNFPLKEWSLKNWKELVRKLNTPVVITGTKEDEERSKEIDGKNVVNLVGKTSLREFMGVLKGAKFAISNDSSAVHVANAFRVPALTIYTATSPKYGFYPLIGEYIQNPAPCSPCSPNPKKCKTGTKECLYFPEPDYVLEKAIPYIKDL